MEKQRPIKRAAQSPDLTNEQQNTTIIKPKIK